MRPGEARFVDPETGDGVIASPRDLRRDYRATVERVVRRVAPGAAAPAASPTTTCPRRPRSAMRCGAAAEGRARAGLMVFLQPLALLLLGVALVPPLLHLFQRRRPPDVVFPSMRYLRQTEREAQRTIRLRHLLLLLLRVAAVALVALAAGRPVVPAGSGAGHEPTALVLILDHSLSSGAVVGRQAGVRRSGGAGARRRSRAAQPRRRAVADRRRRRGAARDRAEALLAVVAQAQTDSPCGWTSSAAVATAARLVRGSGYARGEIHLLSDVQRSAFGAPDSAAAALPVLVYRAAGRPATEPRACLRQRQPGDVAGGARHRRRGDRRGSRPGRCQSRRRRDGGRSSRLAVPRWRRATSRCSPPRRRSPAGRRER